jgi:hypothetical protein
MLCPSTVSKLKIFSDSEIGKIYFLIVGGGEEGGRGTPLVSLHF